MTDYQKYINALRKCAKEHEQDMTFTGHVIVADLCRDTANLLEALERDSVLDKIRADIKAKIEEEEFARSVFRHEEKDSTKAEQCTGSIMAYNNVIKLIDSYNKEREE